jgi:hypothetical protein
MSGTGNRRWVLRIRGKESADQMCRWRICATRSGSAFRSGPLTQARSQSGSDLLISITKQWDGVVLLPVSSRPPTPATVSANPTPCCALRASIPFHSPRPRLADELVVVPAVPSWRQAVNLRRRRWRLGIGGGSPASSGGAHLVGGAEVEAWREENAKTV